MRLLSDEELSALRRLARVLPSDAGTARGARARLIAGRGFDLLGLDPWRDGADPRHLDLPARLRTGAWWVRTFHDESDAALHLGIDASRSLGETKLAAARRLAAALIFVAEARLQPVTVRVLGSDAWPRSDARSTWDRLERLAPDAAWPLPTWFRELAHAVARGDRLVVLTDLADPTPPRELLAPLAAVARSARVDVIHLREPEDVVLPAGARWIRSPEGPDERPVGDASAFAARVARWRDEIAEAAARLGLRLSAHASGESLLSAVERVWS